MENHILIFFKISHGHANMKHSKSNSITVDFVTTYIELAMLPEPIFTTYK